MPFYEYECSSCKFYTEVMQKITDSPLRKCPSCGKSTLTKLVSAPVFRLKGGGWYETDFKSNGEAKRNLAESEGGQKEAAETKSADAGSDGASAKPAGDTKPATEAKPAADSGSRRRSVAVSKPAAARPARSKVPKKAVPATRTGVGKKTKAAR